MSLNTDYAVSALSGLRATNALLRGWRARLSRRPVRTPTVLQMEAVECGAAALAIMLGYFGRFVALEELRVACGVSRDGAKASNLLKAARQFGLQAHGARLDIAELQQQVLPCIVFWKFNHFLVLESFTKQHVCLNDPACGPRRVSAQEFNTSYTGIALLMQPGADFTAGGQRRTLRAALRSRLAGTHATLAYILLASLALVLPGLALPVLAGVFVDNILVERMDSWVKPLLLGLAITAIMRSWLTWLQQSQLARLEMRLALSASATFFWHVLRLPMAFFSQRHAADISQRVQSTDRIAQLLGGELATAAVTLLAAMLYLLVMLQIDAFLTLVGVVLTGLNLLALRRIHVLRKDGSLELARERGRLMSSAVGAIQNIETIKASGAEAEFFARWVGQKTRAANANLRLELRTRTLAVLPGLLNAMLVVIILGLGGKRVIEGAMSLGMLVAFQSLMSSFNQPVTILVGLAGSLQEAAGDLARQDDVLGHPVDQRFSPAPAQDGAPLPPLHGALELRDVSFGYSRLEAPLIEDFNLRIAPGQRIALVGGSGSGKSTIARLVMGLHQPWSGAVLIDGVPRAELPQEVARCVVGGVDQEVYLFAGTVRDNLSLWDQTLPEADLLRAAQDACLHDLIVARSHGYDTPVGEGGANFSGGQAQRIEIARALAGNPRLLVLDEATAALDPATEKTIADNIRRRGCACLVIAHRLSTVRDCDEIIVMHDGKAIERGTHDGLMAQDGAYRRLIMAEA